MSGMPDRRRDRSGTWPGIVAGVLVLGLFGLSWLVPAGAISVIGAFAPPLDPPSARFPLGTDENGVSVLALTLRGARPSWACSPVTSPAGSARSSRG
jgi:ABC-type dipeptide/oligopeptide/nickel transport system permease subunit